MWYSMVLCCILSLGFWQELLGQKLSWPQLRGSLELLMPPLVRNARPVLLYLFALSLALKLLGVAYMNTYLNWNLVAPDTRGSYQPLAEHLLQGHGYQVDGDYLD